jgi:hypothetical protein
MCHQLVLGASGSGKTTKLEAEILALLEAGHGVAVFDRHVDLTDRILRRMPASRREDVVRVDAADTSPSQHVLNLLECSDPTQIPMRAGQVVELALLQCREEQAGPMLRHTLWNGAAVLAAALAEPGTIADITRLFMDAEFRRRRLALPGVAEHAPEALLWWTEAYAKYSDFTRNESLDYYISKLSLASTDPALRAILGRPRSTLDLRAIMDGGGVLLCDLASPGANPLASTFLTHVFMQGLLNAALSRADIPAARRAPFFCFCDEFQRMAGPSSGAMLSEARKMGLSLTLSHQFLDQLPGDTLASVLANVGTKVLFRLSPRDALRIVEFMPELDVKEIVRLPSFVAIVELLVDGAPMSPFTLLTAQPRDRRGA